MYHLVFDNCLDGSEKYGKKKILMREDSSDVSFLLQLQMTIKCVHVRDTQTFTDSKFTFQTNSSNEEMNRGRGLLSTTANSSSQRFYKKVILEP